MWIYWWWPISIIIQSNTWCRSCSVVNNISNISSIIDTRSISNGYLLYQTCIIIKSQGSSACINCILNNQIMIRIKQYISTWNQYWTSIQISCRSIIIIKNCGFCCAWQTCWPSWSIPCCSIKRNSYNCAVGSTSTISYNCSIIFISSNSTHLSRG